MPHAMVPCAIIDKEEIILSPFKIRPTISNRVPKFSIDQNVYACSLSGSGHVLISHSGKMSIHA